MRDWSGQTKRQSDHVRASANKARADGLTHIAHDVRPTRLADLFLSPVSHGRLLDRVHIIRNVEKNAEDTPEPPDSLEALASSLQALDAGICGGGSGVSTYYSEATSRCSRARRALMLERVAIRKEHCEWRDHEAELAWLRESTGAPFSQA